MSLFTVNNVAFDRVLDVWGEDATSHEVLYYTDQVNDISVEVTADEKEYTDNKGAVFYKTYNAKTGTVSITNAMFSTYLAAIAAGQKAEGNTATDKIPRGLRISATANADATSSLIEVTATGADSDTISVIEVKQNGSIVKQLTAAEGSTPTSGQYKYASNKITIYKGAEGNSFVITYDRTATAGNVKIINSADDIPKEHALYIRGLVKEPCAKDLKIAILKVPKFMPSPDTTIAISNEQQTFDFTGDMITDYCGGTKTLYELYIIDGDEDDDEFAIAKNGTSTSEE